MPLLAGFPFQRGESLAYRGVSSLRRHPGARRGPVDEHWDWYITILEEDGTLYLPQDLRERLEIIPGDTIDVTFVDKQGNMVDY